MSGASILHVLVDVSRRKSTQLIAASVASAGAGAGVTYLVLNKKLETKYAELSEREIKEAKEYYSKVYKSKSLDELSEMASAIPDEELEERKRLEKIHEQFVEGTREVIREEEYISTDGEAEEDIADTTLLEDGNEFDYEAEVAKRTKDAPYVITEDEFYNCEEGYTQDHLTYFEADDVLVDKTDQPVDDVEGIVGDDNLARFGDGSRDKNVVYIRNDRLELDMEVSRSTGSYTEEVLGFIQHSDYRPKVMKFRGDRE